MSRARDHVVSDEHAARTKQVLAATPGLAGEPSDAERARTQLAGLTHGHLSTVGARLVAFCRVLAGRAETSSARMVGVDRYGFDVLASDSGGAPKAVRLGFDAPTDTPDAVRAAMVALVHRTR
jgi:putative heme iron utilization protein